MADAVVIDTNVLVTANGRSEDGCDDFPQCVATAAAFLFEIQASGRQVVLDSERHILEEYQRYCAFGGPQTRPGDHFFIWLHQNQANPDHVQQAVVTPNADRGYEEFPTDPELAAFDPADRKFVAAAISAASPCDVANSGDRGWWTFKDPLEANGCELTFLCPERRPAD